MSDVLPWLEYKWSFDFPVGMYRAMLERLRGTPARIEELARGVSAEAVVRQHNGKWSAQEHVGHLWVLDAELHHARFEQYQRGEADLMAADMTNRATFDRNFNVKTFAEVAGGFREAREKMMRLLDALTLEDAARVALHPRLQKQMRLVDLCYFAAEHDDHHLAAMRAMLRK